MYKYVYMYIYIYHIYIYIIYIYHIYIYHIYIYKNYILAYYYYSVKYLHDFSTSKEKNVTDVMVWKCWTPMPAAMPEGPSKFKEHDAQGPQIHFDPVAFALKDLDLVDFNGNCLVVSTYPSEKSWSSSAGIMTFPTEWKVIQNSMVPVTTNQGFLDDLVLSVHLRSHVVGCADHSVGTTFQLAQFLGNLRGAWSAPEISESGVTWELFLAKGPEF